MSQLSPEGGGVTELDRQRASGALRRWWWGATIAALVSLAGAGFLAMHEMRQNFAVGGDWPHEAAVLALFAVLIVGTASDATAIWMWRRFSSVKLDCPLALNLAGPVCALGAGLAAGSFLPLL